MDIVNEINTAINAHKDWIKHVELMVAMAKNNQDMSDKKAEKDLAIIQKIRKDNNCSFGQWLHNIKDENIKNSPIYQEIVALHKQFHQEAAYILVLVLNSEHVLAKELLNNNSIYVRCSQMLITKLQEWKKSFQANT